MPELESVEVQLGEHTFRACAQPHAYLIHHVPGIVAELLEQTEGDELGGSDLVALLGESIYDVLGVFLPKELRAKIPPWEFHGYPTKQAWQDHAYDEETARRTPTLPQITNALETCIALNGGDVFRKMFGWLDPKPIRAAISLRIADSIWQESPSSPPVNGTSASTSSGEPVPTPAPSGSE